MSDRNEFLICWGKSVDGQLATKICDDLQFVGPQLVESPIKQKKIVCGEKHTATISIDGSAYSSGNNDFGQLGRTGFQRQLEVISVLETKFIVDIACGYNHTLLLDSDGMIYGFGDNSRGQLGFDPKFETIALPKYFFFLLYP
ncbi:hypothetical protein MXB_3313 [Myxobolus squamalis]|nr:hypothetical protein MXB_3313 [Myxobolus squamalis]